MIISLYFVNMYEVTGPLSVTHTYTHFIVKITEWYW